MLDGAILDDANRFSVVERGEFEAGGHLWEGYYAEAGISPGNCLRLTWVFSDSGNRVAPEVNERRHHHDVDHDPTFEEGLRSIERMLDRVLDRFARDLARVFHPLLVPKAPAAGHLSGTNKSILGVSMSTEVLVATPPTTRIDGSPLAANQVKSVTFQKSSLGADGVTPGPITILATNTAADPSVGLTTSDLSFTDTSSLPGDDYTCFFTDTNGDQGATSNDVEVPVPAPSPPAAGTLSGTFTP